MGHTISNQRPAELDPVHTLPIKGDYDPVPAVRRRMVQPLYQSMNNQPVSILDDKGHDIDEDAMLDRVLSVIGDNLNPDGETALKDIYQQSLIHFDKQSPLLINEIFAVQAGTRAKLPRPSPGVIYTAGSDVEPAAKSLLAGAPKAEDEFFSSLAYIYHPETLGFWFLTESDFQDFLTWVNAEVTGTLANVLPGATQKLFGDFGKLSMAKSLTESLVLRNDDDSENEEYSFARVLVHLLMRYQRVQAQALTSGAASQKTTGVMPFVVSELFLPRTVVLANVEAHARASAKKIDKEWKLINASLSSPVKVVSNKALSKLTALPRAAAKASAAAATAASNKNQPMGKSASVKFRKKAPSTVDILTGVNRALLRMKQVNRSMNAVKRVKSSFTKANRRDPDDYNKPGKSISTKYLPDLHVFQDTSGSIDESNYQDSIIMLIRLAKKMNVDLYFTSFSHIMSQTVVLKTQNKSVNQIWKEFRRVPKVNGGTDFAQVWDYINASSKRRERLSLMLTDFEWYPGTIRKEHPPNLYYAPVSNMNWSMITHCAQNFTRSMRHIDPAIHQKMIGVIV